MSIFDKSYTRINWENYPSVKTPLNHTDLNVMDAALATLFQGLADESKDKENRKVNIDDSLGWLKNITFNATNGAFTITRVDGSSYTIDTNIEKIALAVGYDSSTQELILYSDTAKTKVLARVSLAAFITEYEFLETSTIGFETESGGKLKDGKIQPFVKSHSIGEEQLQTGYLSDVKKYAEQAKTSEEKASTSAGFADQSKSWAVGGTSKRSGEDIDNSKYYSLVAKAYAEEAAKGMKKATTTSIGAVQPDNSTIRIDGNAVINVDLNTIKNTIESAFIAGLRKDIEACVPMSMVSSTSTSSSSKIPTSSLVYTAQARADSAYSKANSAYSAVYSRLEKMTSGMICDGDYEEYYPSATDVLLVAIGAWTASTGKFFGATVRLIVAPEGNDGAYGSVACSNVSLGATTNAGFTLTLAADSSIKITAAAGKDVAFSICRFY